MNIKTQFTKSSLKASTSKAATTGMVWLMLQSLSGRATAFISQLVLAKLLIPEDYGVLGLAYTIATIFGVLTNVGIGQVMQQRRRQMRLWATQAFWFSLIFSSLVAIAMAICAPFGAKLYHNDEITSVVWVIAVSLPLGALTTVPQAQLQSLMKFKFTASYGTFELICTQLLTIFFAWRKYGALSFVLPIPMMALVRIAVFWSVASLRLRPLRRSKGWSIMLKRGVATIGSNVAVTLVDQGDYLTLGLLASTHVLGIYYFAFRLASQPVKMLAGNFTAVLFPTLVSMNDDLTTQTNAALKAAVLLGVFVVPLLFIQAAVAEPGLTLLFGTKWSEAIPLIQIISIGMSLDAISWPPGSLITARGQFSRMSKYQIVFVPLFYTLVITGALLDSATGVAIGLGIYYVIHPISFSLLTFCKEGVSLHRILTSYFFPPVLGAITIGSACYISRLSFFHSHLIAQIAVIIILGGAGYILAVRYFMQEIFDTIRKKVLGLAM